MKKVKFTILLVSLFFTLPASGYLMTLDLPSGIFIYLTQIFTSIELLRTWFKYKK
jgi:hypothetical protein